MAGFRLIETVPIMASAPHRYPQLRRIDRIHAPTVGAAAFFAKALRRLQDTQAKIKPAQAIGPDTKLHYPQHL
ncbi:hypothetical protein [Chitinimonas sp.]|uniref:hypothetical protein n=1 Tax=Chitinimonas sp. TaxID=1934313 RepID=UPI0035B08DDC